MTRQVSHDARGHVGPKLPLCRRASARRFAFFNKDAVYNILFRATAETLLTIAGDPRHLGAGIGFFAVLHTWGKTCRTTPIFTALSPAVVFPRITNAGWPVVPATFCPSRCSPACFAASSWKRWTKLSKKAA